jgi:CubicO group peptidase (beta-lactamase class C family)
MRRLLRPLLTLMIVLTAFWPATLTQAEQLSEGPTDPLELEAFIDGYLAAQMQNNHIAGATVSVVKDGQLFFTKGYGYADVAQRLPVDPEKTLFRIGSISKLFTWTAVMQLVEQGKLDLDTDVNTYLDFKIPATFPEPITLNHLMAHTSGFEDRTFGMQPSTTEQLTPLGKWLKTHLPARVRPPGQLSAYSNYGAALAGYILERVSGMPFDNYMDKNILVPLGMTHSSSRQPLPASLAGYFSHGYTYINGEYKPQPFEVINLTPAGSFSASAVDMAHFMLAHLHEGHYDEAIILQPNTVQLMHTQNFTHDSRLNGWAHGFFEMDMNGQHLIGHGGDTAFFHSLLILFPEHDLGVFLSTNSSGGAASVSAFQRAFVDHYYPKVLPVITPSADFAQRADRFNGSYRMSRMSYTTPEKLAALVAINIHADREGLTVGVLFNQQRYFEVEPLVFRQVDSDEMLIFREDTHGNITHAFFGSAPEIALEKNRWFETPAFNLGLLGVCIALFLSFLCAAPIAFFVQRKRADRKPPTTLGRAAQLAAGLEAALSLLLLLGVFLSVLDYSGVISGNVPLTGLMSGNLPLWGWVTAASIIIALLGLGLIVFTVLVWKRRFWGFAGRLHYTMVTLAAIAFVWFMYFWNILGKSF